MLSEPQYPNQPWGKAVEKAVQLWQNKSLSVDSLSTWTWHFGILVFAHIDICQKINKPYLRLENKAAIKQGRYQYIRKWYYIWQYVYKNTIKSNENRSPLCQTYRLIFVENFTDSQDRHTGVFDWLIHGVKHHKENQLQSLELLCGML